MWEVFVLAGIRPVGETDRGFFERFKQPSQHKMSLATTTTTTTTAFINPSPGSYPYVATTH
jgi:hypothetical protein